MVIQYTVKNAAIQDIYLTAGLIFFAFAIFLNFIQLPDYKSAENEKALKDAKAISIGVKYSRDLVNEGPMALTPVKFAQHAKEVAQENDLEVEIFDEKKLTKEKMRLLLAVGTASA